MGAQGVSRLISAYRGAGLSRVCEALALAASRLVYPTGSPWGLSHEYRRRIPAYRQLLLKHLDAGTLLGRRWLVVLAGGPPLLLSAPRGGTPVGESRLSPAFSARSLTSASKLSPLPSVALRGASSDWRRPCLEAAYGVWRLLAPRLELEPLRAAAVRRGSRSSARTVAPMPSSRAASARAFSSATCRPLPREPQQRLPDSGRFPLHFPRGRELFPWRLSARLI